MLNNDHFLRRLPVALDRDLRLRVEALVFSYDSTCLALSRLQEKAGTFSVGSSLADRVAMLNDAWQIVEQAHASIVLLKGLPLRFHTEHQKRYCVDFQNAQKLRNEIAHVDAKIPNHSSKKSHSSPFFGALKYFKENEKQVGRIGIEGEVFYVTAGPIPSNTYSLDVDFPDFVSTSIGGFTLEAFDKSLRLDEITTALFDILQQLSHSLEQESTQRAEAGVKDGGDERQLLQPEQSDFVLSFSHTVNFLPPELHATSGDDVFDQLAEENPDRAFAAICDDFTKKLKNIFPGSAASPTAVFLSLLKLKLLPKEMSDAFVRLNLVRHSLLGGKVTLTTGSVQALRAIAVDLLRDLDIQTKSTDLEALLKEATDLEVRLRKREMGVATSFHWR